MTGEKRNWSWKGIASYAGIPILGAALWLVRRNGETAELLIHEVLLCFGYVAAWEDFRKKQVPNELMGAMLGAWVLLIVPQLFYQTEYAFWLLLNGGIGFLIAGAVFLTVYLVSRKGLGGGDVKLMAAPGLYLGTSVLAAMLYGSILAVPLLEEAAGYEADYTLEAESALKAIYLQLAGKDNYSSRYKNLLEKQMARKNAAPEIFREAAQYYLDSGKIEDALSVLRDGIAKTQSEELNRLYEDNRYVYTLSRDFYDEAADIYQGTAQVAKEGGWGIASGSGLLLIPCQYDKISTFFKDRAIVRKDGVISAIDSGGNRVALLHKKAEDFGNFAEGRVGLKMEEGWVLSGGSFGTGSAVFENLGTFSNGGAPAKRNGKWGIIDPDGSEWLVEPQYDGIIQDDLGRCGPWEQMFIIRNGEVFLLADGDEVAGPYEDARPFNGGWAAVKQGGVWGFINGEGAVQIDFQFDDAQSFGQHLAAVRKGEVWGYVSLAGELVIEPQFLEAKSFSGGSAPVRTGLVWQFITLLEYEKDGGLF